MTEKILKEIQKEQEEQRRMLQDQGKMIRALLKRTTPQASAEDVGRQLREVLGEDKPKGIYDSREAFLE